MVQTGLERLLYSDFKQIKNQKLGLLSNQASTASDLVHGRFHLEREFPGQLQCLLSPQHGFFAEKQDNMIESAHQLDPLTGLKVYSLYGESRKPSREMFDQFDVLLIDIVDVGTRVYTFLYSMGYCLEMAAMTGKKVIILDRPNPIGGKGVEGNLLEPEWTSFVGLYPLPMRHGMTFGELALYINDVCGIAADLEIIEMTGWKRSMLFRDSGLPWVFPSPNMPTPETALVYPGQVIWEGTTVSEGRGTTLPFELVGAPYWNLPAIQKRLKNSYLPGCYLRPVVFEPTSGKYGGETCNGFHLHITDAATFRPYKTSLALWQAVMHTHQEEFGYKHPPYEYEFVRLPMDLILGSQRIRKDVEKGKPIDEIESEWQGDLATFLDIRDNYLIYS
ncbi:exo-beta-N-acetylmuramidase NamZ domain-containing protein [Desulfopila sp. IMCC35008]|uniref:exo-beta-N-acetylmuramidase NamZ family protein n=1 Tax=Desulfopila sp. IMCC35008 TaxID=2653858 RepID=UPI0013D6934D|nr:DUF1343 domain-containing protein [Desulfopila sp. IMCC35008]